MDWSTELKQTLKIKKGRRSNKNNASHEEIEVPDNKDSIQLDDGNLSSLKLKKIGVWSDESNDKGFKPRVSTNSIEQERFSSTTTSISTPSREEIPMIPDLDDLSDDPFMNDDIHASKISTNRVAAYKELDIDLVKQNALASFEDLDLSILTKCLQSDAKLNEPDVVWNWEQIFTEVSANIHGKGN